MPHGTRAHLPVLLSEAVLALRVRPQGTYIDCTFGRGGHAGAVLAALGPTGRLVVIDRDPEAIRQAELVLAGDPRCTIIRTDFCHIGQHIERLGLARCVDGILMDLGVSSPQLDDAARGFSFMRAGPLDMRMDPDAGIPASAWLARADAREIEEVLARLGEEPEARRIAGAVIAARRAGTLETTTDLAALVAATKRRRDPGQHPATRVFQAIRMHVNQELAALQAALAQMPELLAPAGRLVVISFHSLEDRTVKQFMRDCARTERYESPLAPFPLPVRQRLRIVGKVVRASDAEVSANPRSRSATLRVAEAPA